jgi:hypothetical protein
MGNSLIMLAVVDSVLAGTCARRYDTLVDGDNALVFLEAHDRFRVMEQFPLLALDYAGMTMTLESPVSVLEQIRFGQSAPIETGSGWSMVRDWRKVISHGTATHSNAGNLRALKPYFHGVALCELSLAKGVPIIGKWASTLEEATRTGKREQLHLLRDYQAMGVCLDRIESARYVEPTAGCRESFARAFGVTPEEQIQYEKRLIRPSFVEWGKPITVPYALLDDLLELAVAEAT